jgi:hypothetical protein
LATGQLRWAPTSKGGFLGLEGLGLSLLSVGRVVRRGDTDTTLLLEAKHPDVEVADGRTVRVGNSNMEIN